MNIALVIFRYDPQRGGAERYTSDLAHALLGRGVQVRVICAQAIERAPGYVTSLGMAGFTRRARYQNFLDRLDEHLAANRYDKVHAMLPVRACDLYHPHAGLAAARPNRKHAGVVRHSLVALANEVNLKRRSFAREERRLLESANPPVVLCLSKYVRAQVEAQYRLPVEKLPILFNGVDIERFDPARASDRAALRSKWSIPVEATVALIVAQDFERKGVRQCIAAVARCGANAYLVVTGKDEARKYREQARALGIEGRVIFTGGVADVQPVYAMSDYFALPTRHDPCSLVALEALAMGLPLVSTIYNGACDAIEDGEQGYVLKDPGDIDALAAAMNRLNEPRLRARMREKSLALREGLSFERHVDRLMEMYGGDSATDGGRVRPPYSHFK